MAMQNQDPQHLHLARRQGLRLALALYFLAMAMGIVTPPQSDGFVSVRLPEQVQTPLFSILVFTAAYFIIIGKRLRMASGFLVALLVFSRLNAAPNGSEFLLLRDALLIALLFFSGGWFLPKAAFLDAPGRIRLARIPAPDRVHSTRTPKRQPHPITQNPDEMMRLFDQISEVH